jgi:hypothetical protein
MKLNKHLNYLLNHNFFLIFIYLHLDCIVGSVDFEISANIVLLFANVLLKLGIYSDGTVKCLI